MTRKRFTKDYHDLPVNACRILSIRCNVSTKLNLSNRI